MEPSHWAQAVQATDDSSAQVLADALSEQGGVVGEFMQLALGRRELLRQRELREPMLRSLGLSWARDVAFHRGLPVGLRAEASKVLSSLDHAHRWPVGEWWLDADDANPFFTALGQSCFDQVTRLTLEGSVQSRYHMFVGQLRRAWASLGATCR